jgi:Mg-chelatase subunit ChlD
MIFATPLAALGLVTAAGLAAVYCFRRKSPPKEVGSLLLWPRPKIASPNARRRDKLILPPIFWLELFALLALVAAALTPLAWRRSEGTLHVVLDTSPSMSATGGEAARLAEESLAREERRGTKDSIRVRRAPDARSLAREIAAAKSIAMPGDEILVLTDTPPADSSVPRQGLRWTSFGRPVSNCAITAVRRLRASPGADSLYVEVRRFGSGADETELSVEGYGTSKLRFDADGRARFATNVRASDGPLAVSIPDDALAADNSVVAAPPDVPAVAAAVSFRNKPRTDLIRRALDATGFVTNYVTAAEADVVFTDGDAPLAPHQYVVRFHESSAARTTGPVWTDPDEPLLDGVALDGDPYAIAVDPIPGTPIAFLGTSPLFSVESNACHVAFSNPQLPFFRSPAFPAFVQNAVAAADRHVRSFRPGAKTPPPPAGLLDADESDLTKRAPSSLGSHADAPENARRTKSVAWIPAVLALLALAFHFRLVRSRTTIAVAVIAALALLRPVFPRSERAGRLVVLADRSRSMTDAALADQVHILRGISAARPADAELAVVSFGRTAEVETVPGAEGFSEFIQDVDRDGSDVAQALEKSAAFIEDGCPARMLLMSDGLFTAPPGDAPARVDTFLQSRSFAHDLFVASVDAPSEVAPNAPVPVTAWVGATETTTNAYALLRGTNVVARGKKVFRPGLTPLVFRDFAGRAGLRRYALEISGAEDDPCNGNNRAEFLVKVEGRRPLLYLHEGQESSVPDVLRRGGVPVEAREAASLSGGLAALEDYGGVLIDNVPAKSFQPSFLRDLAAYATDLGHGLALSGGERSFGPGGWYKTPVEDVLPVSLELRQEHRKFTIALAIVLDRSGSMMATTDGGRTKMDMANLGAAGAIDMLSSMDEVSVIAVDSQPHLILEMQFADQAQAHRNNVLGIRSMGGGIFVEEGLKAGLRQLAKASAQTKHIILFADAADAEEPGNFKSYLATAASAGITVSVIGLGSESDCDAQLLKDIAAAGGGTCQFESDAKEIPRLFMQDTYLVAKTAMCTNVTPVKATSALRQLSDVLRGELAALGGYNLTYVRDDAETAIYTADEEHAPVLAFRRAGLGRTLAFTGELAGPHAAPLMTSKDGAEIAAAIARWTLGDEGTSQGGFHFARRIEAGGIRITAVADEENPLTAVPNSGLRLVSLLERGTQGAERREDSLAWESSDTLSAFVPLYGNETAFPIVVLPDGKPVALPPARLPHPAEFHRPSDPAAGERALARLAERSGGRARASFDDIWDDLPSVRTFVPLAPWIYLAAAFAFLAAVSARRLGIRGTWHFKLPNRIKANPAPKKPRAANAPRKEEKPSAPPENSTAAALALAKRRTSGR